MSKVVRKAYVLIKHPRIFKASFTFHHSNLISNDPSFFSFQLVSRLSAFSFGVSVTWAVSKSKAFLMRVNRSFLRSFYLIFVSSFPFYFSLSVLGLLFYVFSICFSFTSNNSIYYIVFSGIVYITICYQLSFTNYSVKFMIQDSR